jgi:outer membrane receptor protein involved in Fe transport
MPPIPIKDSVVLVSNPELTPEYIWAFDAGLDFTPLADIKVQYGVFYNSMRDLIGQGVQIDKQFKTSVTHANISSAWSAGSELELSWHIVAGLTLQTGYVYQVSRNESASKTAAEFKKNSMGRVKETDIALDYIPNHKGNIGVVYSRTIGKVRMSLSVDEMISGTRHYLNFLQLDPNKGDINIDMVHLTAEVAPPYEKLPAYTRTDVMLRCDVGKFFGAVALQNCFNADYEESFGSLAPGRLATLKVGAQF